MLSKKVKKFYKFIHRYPDSKIDPTKYRDKESLILYMKTENECREKVTKLNKKLGKWLPYFTYKKFIDLRLEDVNGKLVKKKK